MKKKAAFLPLLPLAALILELLPGALAMHFLSPPGKAPHVVYTCYFDLLPFGYGNFGPLVAAVLTVLLLCAALWYLIKPGQNLLFHGKYLAILAFAASVVPVFLHSYTWIGGLISACLAGQTVYLFLLGRDAR